MTRDYPKMYPERKQEPRSNHIHCWWAAHDQKVLNFLDLVCWCETNMYMFKSCSDHIFTKMSFGNVKCVAVRKRISDEIPMIINVFLSLSFASDFEECSWTLGNVGAPSDCLCWSEVSWCLIYYTRIMLKNHHDVSVLSSLTDDCQLRFKMFDRRGSFNRLISSCNCMTILCAHDFLKTLPQIQILDLPTNCQWSTYLMFAVGSNLDLEHLHPHLLFEPLLVLPHPTLNVNYCLIPTHLSMKVVT